MWNPDDPIQLDSLDMSDSRDVNIGKKSVAKSREDSLLRHLNKGKNQISKNTDSSLYNKDDYCRIKQNTGDRSSHEEYKRDSSPTQSRSSRKESPVRKRKGLPERLQVGEWIDYSSRPRGLLQHQALNEEHPVIEYIDGLPGSNPETNVNSNSSRLRRKDLYTLSPIQSVNDNYFVQHPESIQHNLHGSIQSGSRPKGTHFTIYSLFHPITFMTTILHIFQKGIAYAAAFPFMIVAWITRLYLSLSLAVVINTIYMSRKFFYYGFLWWMKIGFIFIFNSIVIGWRWLWNPIRRKKRSQRKESSRTLPRDFDKTKESNWVEHRRLKHSRNKKSIPSLKKPTTDESNSIRDLFHIAAPSRQYKYVVHIPEGRFIPHDRKYRILMKEKQHFSIVLCNDDSNPCCCVILVGGKHVGNVQMNAHSFGSLDRSAYTGKSFIFESQNQPQLRRVHSMESIQSLQGFHDEDVSADVISYGSRGHAQEEPIIPTQKIQSNEFTVEVIFCPLDLTFWNRYKKLTIGYTILALILYRFKAYIPNILLSLYFILIPATFILTYIFYFKKHQQLVVFVLGFMKKLNHKLRELIFGASEELHMKHLDVQQYISDEDLHFDPNDAVRVILTLIPIQTHSRVVQEHLAEHEKFHDNINKKQRKSTQRHMDFEETRKMPISEVKHESTSPLARMMQRTPSRISQGIKNFISAQQRFLVRKLPKLPVRCWKIILSFLDTNSVEFFKMRFVNFQLQKLVDEKVFQELERSHRM